MLAASASDVTYSVCGSGGAGASSRTTMRFGFGVSRALDASGLANELDGDSVSSARLFRSVVEECVVTSPSWRGKDAASETSPTVVDARADRTLASSWTVVSAPNPG